MHHQGLSRGLSHEVRGQGSEVEASAEVSVTLLRPWPRSLVQGEGLGRGLERIAIAYAEISGSLPRFLWSIQV